MRGGGWGVGGLKEWEIGRLEYQGISYIYFILTTQGLGDGGNGDLREWLVEGMGDLGISGLEDWVIYGIVGIWGLDDWKAVKKCQYLLLLDYSLAHS